MARYSSGQRDPDSWNLVTAPSFRDPYNLATAWYYPLQFVRASGPVLEHVGPDNCTVTVLANQAVPKDARTYYFEVGIMGEPDSSGNIGIGYARPSQDLRALVGSGDVRCRRGGSSWGYHSQTGAVQHNSAAVQTVAAAEIGDKVGALLNRGSHSLSIYINGEKVCDAFDNIPDVEDIYPCVSLTHAGSIVSANFGLPTWLALPSSEVSQLAVQLETVNIGVADECAIGSPT